MARLPRNSQQIRSDEMLSEIFGEYFYFHKNSNSHLGLRQRKIGHWRGKLRKTGRSLLLKRDRLTKPFVQPINMERKIWKLAYFALRQFPIKRKTVLFESFMGKRFSDSPGAISKELLSQHPELNQVWSFEKSSHWHSNANKSVVRGSLSYLYFLATAKYLVDNQSWPKFFVKRGTQTYLQTWHGIPLKLMGFDEPDFRDGPPERRAQLQRQVSNWDYLTCPSEYFLDSFVKSFNYQGTLLPFGTPRNDALVNGNINQSEAKRLLGLRTDRKIIFYAPTFRAESRGSKRATKIELDLLEWVDAMGDEVQLLIRPHYLNRIAIPARISSHVVDVSDVDDINALFMASDILVTDYSSLMFDYSVLDKPIVHYAYDLESYANDERGTYFDLRETAPGAIVETQEDLHEAIKVRLHEDVDVIQRRRFTDTYVNSEDGNSTSKTIDIVWGR